MLGMPSEANLAAWSRLNFFCNAEGARKLCRVKFAVVLTIAFVFCTASGDRSLATELEYSPNLPQFGGMNGQALTILQFEKQIVDSRIAKQEAAKREADRLLNKKDPTPTELLVASLTRSLNSQIAGRITEDILNGVSVSDEFILGDITIGYERSDDGTITVSIRDEDGGETVISVPGVVQ